jgi:dTMP kinase
VEKEHITEEGITMKRFVTFEGIDGSGKSTIIREVSERLKKDGHKVMLTYEPTDTPIGKTVQNCIQHHTDPFVTTFTFLADRIQHGHQIRQWLDEGYLVLCDRYADSTYAYQGVQLIEWMDKPMHWLQELSDHLIPQPDRTFLFILDPEIALKRIQKRETLIPFEQVAFLSKVQQNYLHLAITQRFLKVDATETIKTLTALCYEDIIK